MRLFLLALVLVLSGCATSEQSAKMGQAVADALKAYGNSQSAAPPPRQPVNCTTMRNGAYLDTICY